MMLVQGEKIVNDTEEEVNLLERGTIGPWRCMEKDIRGKLQATVNLHYDSRSDLYS